MQLISTESAYELMELERTRLLAILLPCFMKEADVGGPTGKGVEQDVTVLEIKALFS